MQDVFTTKEVTYKLVPPHLHRENTAERALQTFKSHFITFLSGLDPNFSISQWDRLLFQAQLTLNLMQTSHLNPKLSAWTFLFRNFNLTALQLIPLEQELLHISNLINTKVGILLALKDGILALLSITIIV